MNSKKIIIATFSLLLSALVIMGSINFAIDPLFQYHKPWFGLEPVVTNARYQNAGIAKNFDFKNVVIGNSMTENFVVSEVEEVLGGKTAKFTASGSYVFDWTYLLSILNSREVAPKKILINLDTCFFDASSTESKHEIPTFLYDNNLFNDVEYLFNFTLTRKYTYRTISANLNDTVPDYNTVFMWAQDYDIGKEVVLQGYKKDETNSIEFNQFYTEGNLALLRKYIEEMPNTQFMFFCSPFSVLYWMDKKELNCLDKYKEEFEKTFEFMSQYDNVTVYFWTDEEMLNIISDLDNYKDSTHYGMHINKEMLKRIEQNVGELPKNKSEWQPLLDGYFDYLENFDYDKLFE